MQNSKISDWQHPFVDVFKRFEVFDRTQAFKGSITSIQDTAIARRCLKLTGATPSNSSITIPADHAMQLTGRYLYVEMLPSHGKYFVIRVHIALKDREPGVKFVLTNMEKDYEVEGGNTLKIPLHGHEKGNWNIFCVDIEHHLEKFGLLPKSSNVSKGNFSVKKIQICANQTIRGIYTSDNVYDWSSIPKEMGFKVVKGSKWDQFYNLQYFPAEIKPQTVRENRRKEEEEEDHEMPVPEELQVTQKTPQPPLPKSRPTIQAFPEEQLLDLSYALSYSPLYNPDLLIYENKLCYSSGSLIVWKDLETGEQQFLIGHTDYLIAMDSDEDWLVTAQKGAKAIIRIWIGMKCVSSIQAPMDKVQQVRLNKAKYLAMVGLDGHNRQIIMVFDCSEVASNKKPFLIAKQVSDFNILTLRWSPVENDKLVSCGRENIRFWRIKNQHLPGSPVILNHHARNTIFNVLDFERCFDEPNPILQLQKVTKVYVGSQQGLLFQINYHTHELEEIYKLHEGGICSLALSAGFCITGGEDQAIRVWPLDFVEYTLEAEHEGSVTSLAIAEDGIHIACGTSTGGLGVLDLVTHGYRTVLRSHTDTLRQVVHHTFTNSLITLSDDLTIRLWDPEKLEQTYEFSYPKEDPCTCISGNPLGLYFAAGFKSGILRVFDIQRTGILEQLRNHSSEICFVQYSPDGRFLVVIDKTLGMLYSPMHGHQPIKHLPIDMPAKTAYASFSPDSQNLAIIGDSSTHVDLWNTSTLQLIGKIFTGKVTTKVVFSDNGDLWCVFEDCSVRRYNIENLTIEVEMNALHRGSINGIAFDLNHHILFTVGEDSLVKLWDYSFQREPHQAFIGHVGPINGVVFQKGKIWTIGSEGLFMWDVNKKLPQFEPSYVKSRPANFIKALPQKDRNLSVIEESSQMQEVSGEINENINHNNVSHNQPILFSQKLRKKAQEETKEDLQLAQEALPMEFQPRTLTYKKSRKREHKNRVTLSLSPVHIKHNLPFNHIYKQKLSPEEIPYPLKINMVRQNISNFKIKFLIGHDVYGHDSMVWNWVMGWFAYTLDNLLVIDVLGKERVQKIIPLPEKLGQLLISKDSKKLFVSSAFNPATVVDNKDSDQGSVSAFSQKGEEGECANIYIFNRNWEVERKLSFHTRGVQAMAISFDSRFLVSIGNFRECTVCVWEVATGKLRASNYTLDKLNDIKIAEYSHAGGLDFVTVGRDQINFWTFSKDDKLQYQDVFIPKTKEGKLVEITTCEYIDSSKILIGLTNGEIMIVNTETHRTLSHRLLCPNCSEITVMKEVKGHMLVGTMAGDLHSIEFSSILKEDDITNISKISFGSPVMSICLDPDDGEGLVGTSNGVFFTNIRQKFNSILIGNYTSPILHSKIIDDTLLLSVHQNCEVKLWNLKQGVLLKTYKWRSQCLSCYYDPTIGKIFCFMEKINQIKLININRFSRDEIFDVEGMSNDSVIQVSDVSYGELRAKWAFTSKGEVYAFELVEEKKKAIKLVKVLELSCDVSSALTISEKNLLLVTSREGVVTTFNVLSNHTQTNYSLQLVDKVQFSESQQQSQPKPKVHITCSLSTGEMYFSIVENQPFLYVRNFMKRVTIAKLLLSSLPQCINILSKKDTSQVVVGLDTGAVNVINCFEHSKRQTLTCVVNTPISCVLSHKSQMVLVHKIGCAIYSI